MEAGVTSGQELTIAEVEQYVQAHGNWYQHQSPESLEVRLARALLESQKALPKAIACAVTFVSPAGFDEWFGSCGSCSSQWLRDSEPEFHRDGCWVLEARAALLPLGGGETTDG